MTIQILGKKNLFMTTLLLIGLLSVIYRFLLMTILIIYTKKLLTVSMLMYQRREVTKKILETYIKALDKCQSSKADVLKG